MDDLRLMDLVPQLPAPPDSSPAPRAVTDALRDRERLREIAALQLTGDDVGPLLEDLCAQASEALRLPIGVVTVLLDEAQVFAAQHGLGGWFTHTGGTPVEWSFCRFSVATRIPTVISDARVDPLTQDNPLVQQDGLRCYAGIPLRTSRGHVVGSLCVAGTEAREFSAAELDVLRGHADEVVRRLEARRRAERV